MKTKSTVFYISLSVTVLIFVLPPEYTMGVYAPNYLGWFWFIFCLPFTLITFIWSTLLDIRGKQWKSLWVTVTIFVIALTFSIGYWFYMAYRAGNLS